MRMELLVVRRGDRYLRVKGGEDLFVPLDKASVFPMARRETALAHRERLNRREPGSVSVRKLILEEVPFEESPDDQAAPARSGVSGAAGAAAFRK